MLSLQITSSRFFMFLGLILLASCSEKSETDIAVINALEEGILLSNRSIKQSSEDIMFSLKEKTNDRGTQYKASIWYAKAQRVQEISKAAFDFIEKIKIKADKERANIFKEVTSGLFSNLNKYKSDILQIDSNMSKTFEDKLIIFAKSFDPAGKSQEDLYQTFFKNVSVNNGRAMLSHLQNNICVNEEKIVTYCHEQINSHPLYYVPMPFINLSSSIVKPDDLVEITAGIVCFDKSAKPKVYVNNNRVPLNTVGMVSYEFKAAGKTGKYVVPVKINYTDGDGKQQSIQKEIEYTVANIQQQ